MEAERSPTWGDLHFPQSSGNFEIFFGIYLVSLKFRYEKLGSVKIWL